MDEEDFKTMIHIEQPLHKRVIRQAVSVLTVTGTKLPSTLWEYKVGLYDYEHIQTLEHF